MPTSPRPKFIRTFCLLSLTALSFAPSAQAQDSGSGSGSDQGHYELGFHTGPLLPSRVPKVREILSGWGVRGNIPTSKGNFELDTFLGKGDGVTYTSGSIDYRMDIDNDVLPAHFLLGLHADYYSPPREGFRFAGGWHYGGGIVQNVSGPIFFRADFKYRFSPGNSVYVGIGFFYRFSNGSGAN